MQKSSSDLLDQPLMTLYTVAPKWKRLVNHVLDLVFAMITFVGFLFAVGFGTGLADASLPEKLEAYSAWLLVVWLAIYYIGSEWLFKGRTLAKFITKTVAVGEDGNRLTARQLLLRNVGRFIPFDNFSYLFMHQGFHDFVGKTRVVIWQKPTQW